MSYNRKFTGTDNIPAKIIGASPFPKVFRVESEGFGSRLVHTGFERTRRLDLYGDFSLVDCNALDIEIQRRLGGDLKEEVESVCSLGSQTRLSLLVDFLHNDFSKYSFAEPKVLRRELVRVLRQSLSAVPMKKREDLETYGQHVLEIGRAKVFGRA